MVYNMGVVVFSDCTIIVYINTSRDEQNGPHFADDIFKCIMVKENVFYIKISLIFVPEGPVGNTSGLV